MSVVLTSVRWCLAGVVSLGLLACGSMPANERSSEAAETARGDVPVEPLTLAGAEWWPVTLPGKTPTRYKLASKEGRKALRAQSSASASLLRHRLHSPLPSVREVSFSWWVPQPLPGADVRQVASEDAAARVVFAFQGDVSSLPLRTRLQFEVMQALTGELPPYATLMYVFDSSMPVGSVVVNPRSDRIRKIVVDGGVEGSKRWRDHRRNLREDFIRAFGEDPGPLQAVAVMTDTDNTSTQAEAWYGPVTFH